MQHDTVLLSSVYSIFVLHCVTVSAPAIALENKTLVLHCEISFYPALHLFLSYVVVDIMLVAGVIPSYSLIFYVHDDTHEYRSPTLPPFQPRSPLPLTTPPPPPPSPV